MKQRRQKPDHANRHILVAVAGQTPQIVTETLYALMVARRPQIPIAEIFIITTARGAQTARRALLDPDHGQFFAFCREYHLDPAAIAFDDDHIVTIKQSGVRSQESGVRSQRQGVGSQKSRAGSKKPPAETSSILNSDSWLLSSDLDDIRTAQDNAALAQQLLGLIKQLTERPDTALHCSLAGGRKTMSAYMALALTLYGREQDTLSHVLVSEEFESNPKFFFPPKKNRQIPIRRGSDLDIAQTRDARIELAEIPFIRLRKRLGPGFAQLDQSVEETIQLAQHEINLTPAAADRLVVDLNQRAARWGANSLPLSGIHLALYAYFTQTKTAHCLRPELPTCAGCTDCFQEFPQLDTSRFVEIYRRVYPRSRLGFDAWLESKKKKNKAILDAENFQSYVSHINRALKSAPALLRITPIGGYGNKRYGLRMDKTQIDVNS
jgi:CRISPR-associated protein Csx14